MGLFSTLASTATGNEQPQQQRQANATLVSSGSLPTVVQLYTDNKPILLEDTPKVTGYTTLTYQAVQVGASQDVELRNRHSNPDLGVWNCHVTKASTTTQNNNDTAPSTALLDSLLTKIAPQASAYCMTVDLSDESQVEPSFSLLQSTLVRHLIEHPPQPESLVDPATLSTGDGNHKLKTTRLYDLQAVQFGLASEAIATGQNIEETAKDVFVTLMICAVLPPPPDPAEVSESAYKKKQAQALVIYHLRKFASAINAALCFVRKEQNTLGQTAEGGSTLDLASPSVDTSDGKVGVTVSDDVQPAVSYNKLSQIWRDLASGIPVWQINAGVVVEGSVEQSSEVTSTALYGPGCHQEDLIESVLLRNANYPGHWDASKDSLWVALPAPTEVAPAAAYTKTGDEGWLTQLRDSIASAIPPEKAVVKAEEDKEVNPKRKDAAVSSFFESLLKNP